MDAMYHFDYSVSPNQQRHGTGIPQCNQHIGMGSYDEARDGSTFLPPMVEPFHQDMSEFRRGGSSRSFHAVADQPLAEVQSHWLETRFHQQTNSELHVHAPVPLPGCAPILTSSSYHPEGSLSFNYSSSNPAFHAVATSTISVHAYDDLHAQRYHCMDSSSPSSVAVPQSSTFLTPSELLVELSNQTSQARQVSQPSRMDRHCSSFGSSSRNSRAVALDGVAPDASCPTSADAFLVSLPPNDASSEAITSHEKKRHYLECLEHYVASLHDHFRRNGLEPVPLERISSYRCLNSRSIRSLLIHMEKKTRQMRERIFREEQKFVQLREALHQQESGRSGEVGEIERGTQCAL